jgi:uncharacterized protein
MFYIDLDELELLKEKLLLFSHNKFNFFSFKDNEHLQLPIDSPDKNKTTKQHIVNYLKERGVNEAPKRIMLLTNLNVLGYNFNPVSFYFCFDKSNAPLCAIAEVSNTFREMKPYFLGKESLHENKFHLNTSKYFYVSPFVEHDVNFDFNLTVPNKKLTVRIDDYKNNERFFISTLNGIETPLTNRKLFWYSIRFPLIPLRIMGLIHWQAFLLWLKKIHYHKKHLNKHLQQGVYRKYKD